MQIVTWRDAVLLSVLSGAIALGACANEPILTPKTGPGTMYPCGVHGLVCKHSGACCYEEDTCGGDDPTCPFNQCCFVGEARGNDAKMHHPQFQPFSIPK